MAVAGGLDLHRGQLTFDYIDLGTGESWRGRISPADRASLRGWLRRFERARDVDFAVEGCTGWRYVVEELQRAKMRPQRAGITGTRGDSWGHRLIRRQPSAAGQPGIGARLQRSSGS